MLARLHTARNRELVNLLFLAVLTVRPGGLFTSHQAVRELQGEGVPG
jgi:hypothetical protein